ncbi:Uncharacterised protein [Bordetella pertussis]|nr:Uncharacterised protein [Bordetella pertussis]
MACRFSARAAAVANLASPASPGAPIALARRSNIRSLLHAIATHWPQRVW